MTIRLVYDGFVEVDVETCTGRHGMADGYSVQETLAVAVETLLYLDEITKLSPSKQALFYLAVYLENGLDEKDHHA